MDSDTIKLAVGLLVGLMTLTGGALSFINGRLNEAKTTEERRRVVFWIHLAVTMMLAIIAGGLLALGYIALGLIIYALVFLLSVYEYLKNVMRGNAPPLYTSTSLILFSFYAAGLAFLGSTYFTQSIF
ncbi:MAG TPA: hypothetical protein VGI28_01110 [Stellaceae bacterium]